MAATEEATPVIGQETPTVKLTSGGKGRSYHASFALSIVSDARVDYYPQAVDLIARTFVHDPALKFILSGLPEPERLTYLPKFVHSIIKAAALNQGLFEEVKVHSTMVFENDWSCCAVWMPPGKSPANPLTMLQAGILSALWNIGIGGCKRMLIDFQSQSDACKKRGLVDGNGNPIKRFFYLYFIATDFEARGKGLASHVIRETQIKATKENLPIWLEATTSKSRDIYARLGFEVADEIHLGKGTHASTGGVAAADEEAPGVTLWAMIWRPENETTKT